MYYFGTHEAFTELQRLINCHFDKSFKKQTFTLTYKNRYPWMTNSLSTKLTEKNKLGLKSMKKPRYYRIKQTLQKENKSTYVLIKKYRNYLLYQSILDLFTDLPVPPQTAGVVGTF